MATAKGLLAGTALLPAGVHGGCISRPPAKHMVRQQAHHKSQQLGEFVKASCRPAGNCPFSCFSAGWHARCGPTVCRATHECNLTIIIQSAPRSSRTISKADQMRLPAPNSAPYR